MSREGWLSKHTKAQRTLLKTYKIATYNAQNLQNSQVGDSPNVQKRSVQNTNVQKFTVQWVKRTMANQTMIRTYKIGTYNGRSNKRVSYKIATYKTRWSYHTKSHRLKSEGTKCLWLTPGELIFNKSATRWGNGAVAVFFFFGSHQEIEWNATKSLRNTIPLDAAPAGYRRCGRSEGAEGNGSEQAGTRYLWTLHRPTIDAAGAAWTGAEQATRRSGHQDREKSIILAGVHM